ncbi:hypothetical protein BLNAU_14658 [Blattamonas nauphoetae]|uniref:Transforming acidic coiled-coil-containing protein C-terminal domain-containing protein n=1 Tax=Blattamonas nauphoetae TaxID=2049346 RepID=A0ABQ9XGF1_9EUKA|nr:hypothetical protein BLNAU_14658 [Blattamonas nauphoetae]
MFTTLEDVENERQQALDFDTSLIDRLYSLQEEARQDDESYKQQMIEQHGPKFLETGLPTPPSTFSLAPLLSMYKSQSVSSISEMDSILHNLLIDHHTLQRENAETRQLVEYVKERCALIDVNDSEEKTRKYENQLQDLEEQCNKIKSTTELKNKYDTRQAEYTALVKSIEKERTGLQNGAFDSSDVLEQTRKKYEDAIQQCLIIKQQIQQAVDDCERSTSMLKKNTQTLLALFPSPVGD